MSKSFLIGLVVFILLLGVGTAYFILNGYIPFIQHKNTAALPKPSPSVIPSTTPIPLPTKDPSNNVDVKNVDLNSEFISKIPQEKLSFINQAYLTDEISGVTKTPKTSFKEEQEVFLILESTSDTTQKADVYIQDLNQRNFNIKYTINISKGTGYLSIGTSLPASRYRAIVMQENKGLVLNFAVSQ